MGFTHLYDEQQRFIDDTGNQKFLHYLQIAHEAGGKAGLRTAINVNGRSAGGIR